MLLVRDVMTIGVPVCRANEACGEVAARLKCSPGRATALVVLDEAGNACGWLTRAGLVASPPEMPIGDAMDEDIPTVPPDIPAVTATYLMRDSGIEHMFLMHNWPGESRPAAVISLREIEAVLQQS